MELLPLKQYQEPKYPVRQVLDEHPELLRLVPKRWQRNPVILTALTSILTLTSIYNTQSTEAAASKAISHIAPIFQHGDGVGSFGCKAISPPVYLTEDEARHVIIEESKRAGIDFDSKVDLLKPVKISGYEWVKGKSVIVKKPLQLDGVDKSRNINYTFISYKDAASLEAPSMSTALSRNTLADAKMVRGRIAKAKPSGTYAVFYEPLARPNMQRYIKDKSGNVDYRATQEQAETEAMVIDREQLRKQVHDFIKWLKTEGVI